jgi:hypothetical protein
VVSAPNPNVVIPPPRPPLPAGPVSGKRLPYGVAALAVAGLALLLALGSAVFAWRAIDQAKDAKQVALAGRAEPVAPAAASPSSSPSSAAEPLPSEEPVEPAGTGEPAPLDERTVYTPKYEKQSLTLKARECNHSMYADLDEPRANVASTGYDLVLSGDCSGNLLYLRLGEGVEGSESGSAGSTPQDCAEQIRTAPLGEAKVPVRKGVVLCLTTSFVAANERGDDQRMVLVEITGVADGGAVTLKATAWNIPR